MTVQNDLNTIITALEDNLTAMGVTDAEYNSTEGVIGLINQILNIVSASEGILTTVLTCSTTNLNNVEAGDSITITGTLSCVHNGASTIGWNINTVLANQSIKLYNGNTLLTTLTTDSNGAYSYSYTVPSGVSSIVAVFEGNSVCANSNSSTITIEVVENTGMQITFTGTEIYVDDYYNQCMFQNSDITCADIEIDWGDNSQLEISNTGGISHYYSEEGTYTITISGDFDILTHFSFNTDWMYSNSIITDITFPNTISSITNSFFDAGSMQYTYPSSMTLPTNLLTIEDSFNGLYGLTSITIPSSIQEIRSNTVNSFSNCNDLESIIFEGSTPPTIEGMCFDSNSMELVIYVPQGSLTAYEEAIGGFMVTIIEY